MQDNKKEIYKQMPYEKFMKAGAESLSDAELLAIILRTGTKGADSVAVASEVLNLFPSKRQKGILGLHHITLTELMSIRGIGQVKAVKLKCIAELSLRLARTSAEQTLQLTSPKSVADFYMEQLRHLDTEEVRLLMMDNRNHLISEKTVSRGTVNASLLSPREVFILALKHGAVYIMLLHNHPGGDPTPGKQDILVTEQVKKVSKLIEIPLIDHIIIGDKKYFSFKEMGYL